MDVERKQIGENAEEVSINGRMFRVRASKAHSGSLYVARCEVFDTGSWTTDMGELPGGWSPMAEIRIKREDPGECVEAAVEALIEFERQRLAG